MGEAQFVNMGVIAETPHVGSRGFSEEVTLNSRNLCEVGKLKFFFFFRLKNLKGILMGNLPKSP